MLWAQSAILFTSLIMVFGDPTRVEFKISSLKNPDGILANGKRCDRMRTRHCDPLITATIDTDSPTSQWPGSKPVDRWTKVYQADEKDSALVNKIVSKDICNGVFDKANLRVNVVDVDATQLSPIEMFECMSGRDVASRESSAQWSREKECFANHNPDRVKLMYSWRAFTIPNRECGQPITGESGRRRNQY